jgi:hypothetical protein
MPDLATLRDRSRKPLTRRLSTECWRLAGVVRRGTGALRNGLPAARRAGDAAGALGAHRGQLRLRRRHRARLAHHDLPAVFRGGRHLLRFSRWCWRWPFPSAKIYGLEDFITDAPPGQLRQGDAGDRTDRGLRLHHGSLHGLVQRQHATIRSLWNRLHGPYAPWYYMGC